VIHYDFLFFPQKSQKQNGKMIQTEFLIIETSKKITISQ